MSAMLHLTSERHVTTICHFSYIFLSPWESWQLLAGCCHHAGAWHSCSLPEETWIQGVTCPMFWYHVLPTEGQLFPAPHLLCLRNQRNSYPKSGTSGHVKKQEQLRMDPPTQGMRFHTIKTFWYLLRTNISIFICTSGFSQRVMVFENIFLFTSSTCNPLCSVPRITVSTWIIMCCLHFRHTPRKYLRWLQKHMLPETFLPDQTGSKQAALCSWPKQPDQDLHKINLQEPHIQ